MKQAPGEEANQALVVHINAAIDDPYSSLTKLLTSERLLKSFIRCYIGNKKSLRWGEDPIFIFWVPESMHLIRVMYPNQA